jgi:hypothetical protein
MSIYIHGVRLEDLDNEQLRQVVRDLCVALDREQKAHADDLEWVQRVYDTTTRPRSGRLFIGNKLAEWLLNR